MFPIDGTACKIICWKNSLDSTTCRGHTVKSRSIFLNTLKSDKTKKQLINGRVAGDAFFFFCCGRISIIWILHFIRFSL